MLQDHEHEDGGHTHSCTASSTSEPHGQNTYWNNNGQSGSGRWVLGWYDNQNNVTPDHVEETTVSVSTTCSLASQTSNIGSVDTENSNAGHETRPANMKILYIIRVF